MGGYKKAMTFIQVCSYQCVCVSVSVSMCVCVCVCVCARMYVWRVYECMRVLLFFSHAHSCVFTSLIFSYKYHCLCGDNPEGVMTVGKLPSVYSAVKSLCCLGMDWLARSFTNTSPGYVLLRYK